LSQLVTQLLELSDQLARAAVADGTRIVFDAKAGDIGESEIANARIREATCRRTAGCC
jgi:hypothetical protein